VVMVTYSEFQCPFCGKFARDTEPEVRRASQAEGDRPMNAPTNVAGSPDRVRAGGHRRTHHRARAPHGRQPDRRTN
jgi:hypothetical protein